MISYQNLTITVIRHTPTQLRSLKHSSEQSDLSDQMQTVRIVEQSYHINTNSRDYNEGKELGACTS